jgi:hypothetical protein
MCIHCEYTSPSSPLSPFFLYRNMGSPGDRIFSSSIS